MSKKKKKYDDGIERDEEGLTASDRAIVDSIDFDKIAADVASRHDEIVAEATATAMAKTEAGSGKTKRTGIISFAIGIFFIIGGFLSLDAGVGLYFLIAGALMIIFGICMFSIASSNKKLVADYKSGKDTEIGAGVTVQQDARAEAMVTRFKGTAMKEKKPGTVKQMAGVLTFLIGFFLIFAAFVLFLEEELGAYLLGVGAFLLIIGIILLIMARAEKK